MQVNRYEECLTMGLLPEPERRPASFVTSAAINTMMLLFAIYVGMMARHVIQQRQYEQTILIVPSQQEDAPKPKPKMPEPPKVEEPKLPDVKLEAAKIKMPRMEPKPDVKPIEMEAKLNLPAIKTAAPKVVEAPQPKAALVALPPQPGTQAKASAQAVHFGDPFGVVPNPNATRPATVAAIGSLNGGMRGASVAPHGVVGGTGIGGPGTQQTGGAPMGKVAAAGIPAMAAPVAVAPTVQTRQVFTNLEVISKPPVQYTSEAKQLHVQGDVVLRVTFTAGGQVVVQSVVHGLGHGLDEEARRVALLIRFRPATKNGQAVDLTTNITISFQLA